MTKEATKTLLPIIQAWADGKTIQYRSYSGGWEDIYGGSLSFDDAPDRYRIKREPREWWINYKPAYGFIGVHDSADIAKQFIDVNYPKDGSITTIHVREVL